MNDQIKYYEEHGISPETHDISDINLHYERRRKLYRNIGLPIPAFKKSNILEVGAGSGYSTLALFNFMSYGNMPPPDGHVDILEPNERGRKDMEKLFDTFQIDKKLYNIYPFSVEDYFGNLKYDIVLCEGFLPIVDNQQEVVAALSRQVESGGVVVITCQDAIGSFIESIKRLLSVVVTKDITDFNEKVYYLANIFSSQLKKLRGVSRSAVDWVEDQILAPMGINEPNI